MDDEIKVTANLQSFSEIRKKGLSLIKEMICKEMNEITLIDMYFIGLIDKSCFLIDGMIGAIKDINCVVVGILLRGQMDNCLRALAITLTDNHQEFVTHVFKGEKISKFKDRDNKKMRDFYLIEKINCLDSKFKQVYERACNYVHFSGVGMFHTLHNKGLERKKLGISVGLRRAEDFSVIEEGSQAFLHYTELLYKLVENWIKQKRDILHVKNETKI